MLRWHLCQASELKKRQADGHVPNSTICIVSEEGCIFATRGTMLVVEGRTVFAPGLAIWCDRSVDPKVGFKVGGNLLAHKPNVLYFITKEGKIVQLAILPATERASRTPTGTETEGPSRPTMPHAAQQDRRPAKLELVSVSADKGSIAGQPLATFWPTIRATKIADAPVPKVAHDMWLLVVYVSGSPSNEEVVHIMRRLKWEGRPSGRSMTLPSPGHKSGKVTFRHASNDIRVEALDPKQRAALEGVHCYASVLAPDENQPPWDLSKNPTITFFVQSFSFEKIVSSPDETPRMPEPKGVAAVCLCAFESDGAEKTRFVELSEPLAIRLDCDQIAKGDEADR